MLNGARKLLTETVAGDKAVSMAVSTTVSTTVAVGIGVVVVVKEDDVLVEED